MDGMFSKRHLVEGFAVEPQGRKRGAEGFLPLDGAGIGAAQFFSPR